MLKAFDLNEVCVLPGLFRERMVVNRDYLMELGTQELLQNFYLEAGIIMPGLQVLEHPEQAKLHWGWEAPTCQLRGHFLGHWLSAAAALIASERDEGLRAKLNQIVSELGKCQACNGGQWVAPIPEKYFRIMESDRYIWSPQYVMHKTIMGLVHAYQYAGNRQALEIVNHLSDWYLAWTREMLKKNPSVIYKGEAGGMLEMWATLYELTKDEKYMTLAERYSRDGLLDRLLEGKDALTGCHANASIPLSHGTAKLYEVTGEEKWRRITERFWENAVTKRGAYCTGGQNAGEFWIPPFQLGQFMGERNQEFCTVYNMVRTAAYLYRWTQDTAYADYIERNLYNGFLAQQNQYTGMPTYFLPLQAGSRKKWGSRTRDFWCCHGTMVQAQTSYPGLIYFEDTQTNRLIVSQYIPSRLHFHHDGQDVVVEQTTDMKYYDAQAFFDEHDESGMSRWSIALRISAPSAAAAFSVALRVPEWAKGTPALLLNGQPVSDIDVHDGYITLTKEWRDDEIVISFRSVLEMEALPDMPELAALREGPIVLAGLCGQDEGLRGDFSQPDTFLSPQTEHTYDVFPWKQSTYRTRFQPKNITFKPLYEITDETYTVYFSRREGNE